MLQWIRDAKLLIKGFLWAVVLAFVVTIFYSWGVRSSGNLARSEVATIYGQPVSVRDFQRTQNALQQRYRDIFRTQPGVDLNEHFNFREMALEQLATRAILLRMAQQYGVVVTEQELYDSIASIGAFQEQGQFSPDRYKLFLRSRVPPMTPRQFEVEQAYHRDNERAAVRYVLLTPAQFEAQVTMTDEELQAYYASHKEAYREPEQRQIRYVALPLQRFTQHYNPTPEEISDYYARHSETFQHPEQVHARHILVKVVPSASAEQVENARKRAEALLTALRNGEDFATVAQQHSEDTATAAKGGDLGYFPRGQMVQQFEEVAFTLPVGQLSELVRSPFGWHILRVEDK